MKQAKNSKQMERHIKGVANHWRISILLLISRRRGITLEGLTAALRANEKTIGEHTRRLTQAGLINKRYRGRCVEHSLSPYGKLFVHFLKSFEQL